ncbi:MAG: DNA-binding response regulator [Bacteroidetes bacterium]|nr:MAG: DNA-binding response regulator [Bacteroidota bacterium]
MKCLSIDDNPMALEALSQLIQQVDFLEYKGGFTNALEALPLLEQGEVDLIFLDIEMPKISGLELIDTLAHPPLIIMVSAKQEYAINAFEKHVVDYLLKPVRLPRFLSAVNFAKKLYESRQKQKDLARTIFVKANGKWNKLVVDDIKYLQAMGDYVRIFTKSGSFMVNNTMKNLLQNLPENQFVRTHRSYIVNINQIDNIEDNTIVIDRDVIPISERFKASFLDKLNLL